MCVCVCAYIFVSVYTNVVRVSVYSCICGVYNPCKCKSFTLTQIFSIQLHLQACIIKKLYYIYMAPCKYMESCKCHVVGFRRQGDWMLGAIASHFGFAPLPRSYNSSFIVIVSTLGE